MQPFDLILSLLQLHFSRLEFTLDNLCIPADQARCKAAVILSQLLLDPSLPTLLILSVLPLLGPLDPISLHSEDSLFLSLFCWWFFHSSISNFNNYNFWSNDPLKKELTLTEFNDCERRRSLFQVWARSSRLEIDNLNGGYQRVEGTWLYPTATSFDPRAEDNLLVGPVCRLA